MIIHKQQISPAHPITITIVWDIIHYPHKENRIKLFDGIQREMLRKSNYVLFKFQANLLILKNLRRIGPTKYHNICTRGLEVPKKFHIQLKKKAKTSNVYYFKSFSVLFYLLASFRRYDSKEIKDGLLKIHTS